MANTQELFNDYGLNPKVKQNPELRENNVLLSVQNLKQYFTMGKGRNKSVLRAVSNVSFDVHEGECVGIVTSLPALFSTAVFVSPPVTETPRRR